MKYHGTFVLENGPPGGYGFPREQVSQLGATGGAQQKSSRLVSDEVSYSSVLDL